jgi:hypothetical protein
MQINNTTTFYRRGFSSRITVIPTLPGTRVVTFIVVVVNSTLARAVIIDENGGTGARTAVQVVGSADGNVRRTADARFTVRIADG